MKGARQHILLEFFEKLFAVLAFGSGSLLSPIAIFALVGRRTSWRKYVPKHEVPATIAYREIVIGVSFAMGALLTIGLKVSPFDRIIQTVVFLVLSTGSMLLAERSSGAFAPRFHDNEWRPKGLRNLLGWFLLGILLLTFLRGIDTQTLMLMSLIATAAAFLPYLMAGHRGEPGLLLPGAAIAFTGVMLWNPWLFAFGMGWVMPAALTVTFHLKASLPIRSLVCWGGALLGLILPPWAANVAAGLILLLTLESWRFIVRLAIYLPLRAIHRFKVYGIENTYGEGAGLVVSNHVSLADGWLLGAMTQRMCRFLVYDAYYKNPTSRFLLNLFRTIPISQGGKREVIESLREARRRIEEGHFAGIFPEGGITRSGHLHPFQKGFTRIVGGSAIPVIPAYMNGLWASFASFSEAKVTLRPGRLFRPFEIEYGEPLPSSTTAPELWAVVKSLEVRAAYRDSDRASILPVAFLESASRHHKRIAFDDGARKITYGNLASRALLLAGSINRRHRKKTRIGIFLPDGVEKIVAHVACALSGHLAMEVAPLPAPELDAFLGAHAIPVLITSQAWLDTHEVPRNDNMIMIGRTLEHQGSADQSNMSLLHRLSPKFAWRQVCKYAMRRDSAAVVVSSPTGPVVFSHRTLWAASNAARRVLWLNPGMKVRSQLPIHRAAGVTLGLWWPLLHGATITTTATAVDFELVDGQAIAAAHPDSRCVLVTNPDEPIEGRYCSILEVAEAGGILALASPPVDFMGEVQSGQKKGTLGRLPFGLEMRETETGVQVRTPARMLRYFETRESKVAPRPEEWLDIPLPLELDDQCFVHLRSTSEPQTSSTPLQGQTSSHPQGE